MSFGLLAVLAAVTLVSAFIQGALGIGFALIVAPIVGMLKPDLLPVTLLLLMLPLNLHVAARERAHVDWSGAIWITIQEPWITRLKTSRARLSPPSR